MICVLRRCSVLAYAALTLVSCARSSDLPPEEVMRRAARATQNIESARFVAAVTFDMPFGEGRTTEGTLEANGRMAHRGEQLAFSFTTVIESQAPEQSSWSLKGDVVVAGEQEVYIKMDEWTVDPPQPALQAAGPGGLVGAWLKLPPQGDAPVAASITPDPRFLQMQTDIVDVSRDRGRRMRDGREVYEYDVAVNRDKLIQFLEAVARERGEDVEAEAWRSFAAEIEANGVLAIDAETFFMQGVQWNVQSSSRKQPFTLTIDVRLAGINEVEPIAPPSGALDLPASPFQGIPGLPGVALPPA